MTKLLTASIVSALFLLAAPAAQADPLSGVGAYLQYGETSQRSDTASYTFGVTKSMGWSHRALGVQATGYWDLDATRLSANNPVGRDDKTWVLGVTPTLRLRLEEGRSPWFVEGGIGVSYSDVLYRNQVKQFSTRFNFADHVGVGFSFGPQRNQELVLRLQHFSNASIKKPNPGENYVQLRYAYAF